MPEGYKPEHGGQDDGSFTGPDTRNLKNLDVPGKPLHSIAHMIDEDGYETLHDLVEARFSDLEYTDEELTEAFDRPDTYIFESMDPGYYIIELKLEDGEVYPLSVPKSLLKPIN